MWGRGDSAGGSLSECLLRWTSEEGVWVMGILRGPPQGRGDSDRPPGGRACPRGV